MNRRSSRGFSLIELLVVLAIVATLLSIVSARYVHQVDKAKEVALRENLALVRQSLDHFYADKDHYPESLEELVHGRYLRRLPQDPLTDRDDTWVLISQEESGKKRIIDIRSGASGIGMDGTAYSTW